MTEKTKLDIRQLLDLIDEADFAAFRDMTVPALRNERARRAGPPYQRIGRRVFYPLAGVRKFLADNTVTPTNATTLINGSRRDLRRLRT